jgi:plastocyanin
MVAVLFFVFICTSTATPATPHRVEVTAKRFAFEPAEITLKRGEAVELVMKSVDVAHAFAFENSISICIQKRERVQRRPSLLQQPVPLSAIVQYFAGPVMGA